VPDSTVAVVVQATSVMTVDTPTAPCGAARRRTRSVGVAGTTVVTAS
jgi:hypothetical protein